jgi:hypothetical protein
LLLFLQLTAAQALLVDAKNKRITNINMHDTLNGIS